MKAFPSLLATSLFSLSLLVCCSENDHSNPKDSSFSEHKYKMDSIASRATSSELNSLVNASLKTGDEIAAMCFYRELGRRERDSSFFQSAIYCHGEALNIARKLKDTLGIITMLNQQGTNYRRINANDVASECYYEAIKLGEEYSDNETETFLKIRDNSYNGLGNIFKDIKQEDDAEALFRQSMEGERILGNHLGLAINTANLGSIFEHRGQLDSAMAYYRMSFNENTIAESALGIALCYNHFGRINEEMGQIDSALIYYSKAYESLGKDANKWYWLGSCISLARVQHIMKKDDVAKELLADALETAYEINSWTHLGDIFGLRSEINKTEGAWKSALEDVAQSIAYKDSVEREKQMTHVQALQHDYLEQQAEAAIAKERQKTMEARHQKSLILWIGITLLVSLLIIVHLLVYSLKMRSKNFEAKMSVEKARQDFFTNVTHDFRTPLTVILGQAELIRSRGKDEKDIESSEAIIRQSDILMDLINQIMDLSKVKSSTGNAEWRRGNILPLITMAVENARLAASPKNINIYYSHSPELDGSEIDFIPDFMKKIFTNILSNAVKYTKDNGNISIEASIEDNCFVWKASDTGIGIKADDLDKIFIPFYRTESAADQKGNGIGLALTKQMVEAMEGTIEVESIEWKGTTFTVRLPVQQFKSDDIQRYFHMDTDRRNDEIHGVPELDQEDGSHPEDPIVLIVEDNIDIAKYMSELLKEQGQYQIKTAINGKGGLSAIEEYVPDLIITDLMMPDINGLELCRRVRASEVLNHIPIVVVTAKDREADRLAGIEAGADAFIVKPFNSQELIMIVNKLLESRNLLREKYSAEIKDTEDMSKTASSYSETDKFLAKLTSTIMADLASPELSSDYIADKLCLSPSSVNRKVKSITGMSTSAYITATKISMAKKLLSTTDKSIGEISDICGFEYQSYFNRLFKNNTGYTPIEYRSLSEQGRKKVN